MTTTERGRQMTVDEAAARLGVKRQTLYAYVSRGALTSHRGPDGRSSLFSPAEVEALAARTRRGGRAGSLEVVVASGISLIEDDQLYYRGRPAVELAATTAFETVADWLWTGDPAVFADPPRWPPAPTARRLPVAMDMVNRLRLAVAWSAAGDDLRYDLSPAAVTAAGRRLVSALPAGLPLLGPEPSRLGPFPVAARLWPRVAPTPGSRGLVAALNAALVLLADHELAASTLAARVAASVRADPYSVVSTGLGVMAGSLHGAASLPVVELLEETGSPGRAAAVVGERLRRGERLPGLGHQVYRERDPRADALLASLRSLPLPERRWSVVEAILGLVTARLPLVVNVDFALGAMVFAAGMDRQAGEAVFSVARTAGWVAHALEEYAEPPVRFRPRAAYTGIRPSWATTPAAPPRRR